MIASAQRPAPGLSEIHDCPVVLGELLARKYRVTRLLGVGGMGIVVSAWHNELEHRVAIKFLRRSFAQQPEAAERFRREARAAVKIRGEHVVRVLDVASLEDGVPYIVMEYLEGENLDHLLRSVGRFDVREVSTILLQVCDALADAHVNQIIHRDLKPANIHLMHREGRPPLVKVLDFGISKSLAVNTIPQLRLTEASVVLGSPFYMAPEQLDSKAQIGPQSDIWGLGVLMFELLTTELPFSGDSIPQIVRAVISGERRPITELNAEVPPEFEAIVARCLSVLPEERFQTVQDLAQALRPFACTEDTWAERFDAHLTPKPAEAAAYGVQRADSPDDNAESALVLSTAANLETHGPQSGVVSRFAPTLSGSSTATVTYDTALAKRRPWLPLLMTAVVAALGGAWISAKLQRPVLTEQVRSALRVAPGPAQIADPPAATADRSAVTETRSELASPHGVQSGIEANSAQPATPELAPQPGPATSVLSVPQVVRGVGARPVWTGTQGGYKPFVDPFPPSVASATARSATAATDAPGVLGAPTTVPQTDKTSIGAPAPSSSAQASSGLSASAPSAVESPPAVEAPSAVGSTSVTDSPSVAEAPAAGPSPAPSSGFTDFGGRR